MLGKQVGWRGEDPGEGSGGSGRSLGVEGVKGELGGLPQALTPPPPTEGDPEVQHCPPSPCAAPSGAAVGCSRGCLCARG